MQWYKHDSDANMDARLQEVLLDYGLEGYGLYWYCLELITSKVSKENITFELEHDARIIARNTGSTVQRVEEMMKKFVSLGLFENTDGKITCFKLAKRIDKSMTNSPQMREIIELFKNSGDVMTSSENVMLDKNRIDKNRIDKKPIARSALYEQGDMDFSIAMFELIKGGHPHIKKPNLETWAKTARLMRERDGRDLNDAWAVVQFAQSDDFWSPNILSMDKLRKQFDQLKSKMTRGTPHCSNGLSQTTNSNIDILNSMDFGGEDE